MGSLIHIPSRSKGTSNASDAALNLVVTCNCCGNSRMGWYVNSFKRLALRRFTTMHFSKMWVWTTIPWKLIFAVRQYLRSTFLQATSLLMPRKRAKVCISCLMAWVSTRAAWCQHVCPGEKQMPVWNQWLIISSQLSWRLTQSHPRNLCLPRPSSLASTLLSQPCGWNLGGTGESSKHCWTPVCCWCQQRISFQCCRSTAKNWWVPLCTPAFFCMSWITPIEIRKWQTYP